MAVGAVCCEERAPPARHVDALVDQQFLAKCCFGVECVELSHVEIRWWRDHIAAADDDAAATTFDLFVAGLNCDNLGTLLTGTDTPREEK